MPRNPWIEQHMAAEMDYTGDGYTRRQAARLVRSEYAGHDEPETCGICGGEAHYRATVGAIQCPNCRAIRYGVWVHLQDGTERRTMNATDSPNYRLEYRWMA